jgi:hypothetical protein
MTTLIQIAQAGLFPDELVAGVWNAAVPEDFCHTSPTVDGTPQNLPPETRAAGTG